MFHGRASSWNLRDRHMADTLHALRQHFQQKGQAARVVVWEHNSHIGDARATEMAKLGEWNVGQLIREADQEHAVLVGFTTYEGSVTAARDWDQPPERMRVRPALPTSYEALFHATGIPRFLLLLDHPAVRFLEQVRLERAIGVVYR